MIRINQLALEVGHGPGAIKKKAARLLKVPETSIRRVDVVRRSIDARKKDRILYSYIVDVKLAEKKKEETAVKKADSRNIQIETEARYRYPAHGKEVLKDRPVIIGAGPAGLFAALALAENGFAPLLLEQGDPVEVRAEKVEAFWRNGDDSLDLHSNVQFGEGGAGTFSDGKLNTLVKDVSGRNGKVLETFVEAGADGSILYDSRPHIGTDVLREVVKNIRKRIQDAGGEVRFGCRVEQVLMEDGRTGGVLLAGGERIQSRTVVLAVGHSARALFSSLWEQKVLMEPKAFAVGLRVQHPQKMINLSQYGREDAGELGAAPYKVTASTKSGRGVYSFCMVSRRLCGQCLIGKGKTGRQRHEQLPAGRRERQQRHHRFCGLLGTSRFPAPWAEWSSSGGWRKRRFYWGMEGSRCSFMETLRRTGDRRPWETWRPSSAAAMPFPISGN